MYYFAIILALAAVQLPYLMQPYALQNMSGWFN